MYELPLCELTSTTSSSWMLFNVTARVWMFPCFWTSLNSTEMLVVWGSCWCVLLPAGQPWWPAAKNPCAQRQPSVRFLSCCSGKTRLQLWKTLLDSAGRKSEHQYFILKSGLRYCTWLQTLNAVLALKCREQNRKCTAYFCVLCSRLAIKQIGKWAWPESRSTEVGSSLCVLTVVTGQSAGGREEASSLALDLISPSDFRKTRRGSESSWTTRKAQWRFTTQRQRPTSILTAVAASLNHCIPTSTHASMRMGRTLRLLLSVLSSRERLQSYWSKLS